MSTILDRARMMFAAAVASMVGASLPPVLRGAWGGFVRPAQRSRHTVAQDKRAARKARNVKRNKA